MAENPVLPEQFDFSQNYPNPFNPNTRFEFSLPISTHVKLDIINVLGQKVTELINEQYEAGKHIIEWNGHNESGGDLASGVYFAQFSAGSYHETRKMVVVK